MSIDNVNYIVYVYIYDTVYDICINLYMMYIHISFYMIYIWYALYLHIEDLALTMAIPTENATPGSFFPGAACLLSSGGAAPEAGLKWRHGKKKKKR